MCYLLKNLQVLSFPFFLLLFVLLKLFILVHKNPQVFLFQKCLSQFDQQIPQNFRKEFQVNFSQLKKIFLPQTSIFWSCLKYLTVRTESLSIECDKLSIAALYVCSRTKKLSQVRCFDSFKFSNPTHVALSNFDSILLWVKMTMQEVSFHHFWKFLIHKILNWSFIETFFLNIAVVLSFFYFLWFSICSPHPTQFS